MGHTFLNREPMLNVFLFKTTQLTERLEQLVLENAKTNVISQENAHEILRIMLTIKGSATKMMFNNISEVAHWAEELFYFIIEKKPLKTDSMKISEIIQATVVFIKAVISKIEKSEKADMDPRKIIVQIEIYLNKLKSEHSDLVELQRDQLEAI